MANPTRHQWLEDCITRGVPCHECNCAPEALSHFGVKEGYVEAHEYLPSEQMPLALAGEPNSLAFPPKYLYRDSSGTHITEVAPFNLTEADKKAMEAFLSKDLFPTVPGSMSADECPVDVYHTHSNGTLHITIELTEEEKRKYHQFFSGPHDTKR